jgi:hypothetical protein
MDSVVNYGLDKEVFDSLNQGIEGLKDWQGAASGIAEYVASWGMERFWAMSRSCVLKDGEISDSPEIPNYKRRYYAWLVAREVLCKIVGADLRIKSEMTTTEFQERFRNLDFQQQTLLIDVLIEVADAIQFWTMRLKDVNIKENNLPV